VKLRLSPRSPSFGIIIGIVVGVLCTGLTVPYLRTQAATTSTRSAAAGQLESPAGSGGGSADGSSPEAVGGTGSGPASGGVPGALGAGPGGESRQGSVPGAPGAAQGGPLTASDVGVTPASIKIGVAILDVGAAKDFGYNFDLGDQQARYNALIAAQNAKGGINGRKIVPVYKTLDAANPVTSDQAACVAWTKDAKVFSVLVESEFVQSGTVCVIGQGATPLFTTDGIDDSYYANGLYFSTQASDNRIVRDHAHYLAEKGVLKGKKIGILTGDGAERLSIDHTLVPMLKQLGYSVADIEVVPGDTTGTQKLPIAVSNFKAAGVNFVIVEANVILAGPFVQAAHRAGFDPQYALSDFNNEINDQVAGYYPDTFDGTVALSTHQFPLYRAGQPPPPADQGCLDRVQRVDPKVMPATNSAHEVAMGECAIFDAWVAAATAAGPDLTRANLVRGANTLRSLGIAGTLGGSFASGKHDAVDSEREVQWHKTCKCWELVAAPNVVRHME
jgi:hypothetical protein